MIPIFKGIREECFLTAEYLHMLNMEAHILCSTKIVWGWK